MLLQDVIKHAQQTGEWFRPATWASDGIAYRLSSNGQTLIVPTSNNGHPQMTCSVGELLGEWETISPIVILAHD